MKNNKGYSLIELIIVLAIMSVLGGTITFSYSMVANKAATQCAKNIQLSVEKSRVSAMGKNNARITIYSLGDAGIYMKEETNYGLGSATSVVTKIGKKGVDVYYEVGGAKVALDGTGIVIEFNRSDGSLKTIKHGTDVLYDSKTSVDKSFTIYVERKTRKYTVKIEALTGRVTTN